MTNRRTRLATGWANAPGMEGGVWEGMGGEGVGDLFEMGRRGRGLIGGGWGHLDPQTPFEWCAGEDMTEGVGVGDKLPARVAPVLQWRECSRWSSACRVASVVPLYLCKSAEGRQVAEGKRIKIYTPNSLTLTTEWKSRWCCQYNSSNQRTAN